MKNLKRSLAIFVSAVMIMTMLVGCGSSNSSSSVARKLRSATGTSKSSSLDALVESIVEKGTFSSAAIQGALSDNNYQVTEYKFSNNTATATVNSTGIASGSYITQTIEIKYMSVTQEALLASADSTKDAIDDSIDALELSGYTVDTVYLSVAEFGTNQWIVAISYVLTYTA